MIEINESTLEETLERVNFWLTKKPEKKALNINITETASGYKAIILWK
jgi:hypothetical protein